MLRAAVFFLLATPAAAGPHQIVGVTETVLGVNDTHVFVLRTVEDNLDSYYRRQADVLLIARSRADNRDDETWPVARSRALTSLDPAEFAPSERVTHLPIDTPVDPFAVLAERHAQLWPTEGASRPEDLFDAIRTTADALTLEYGRHTFVLSLDAVAMAIPESLRKTADSLPQHPDGDHRYDVLREVAVEPGWGCRFDRFLVIRDSVVVPSALVRANCDATDGSTTVAMFLSVPWLLPHRP